MRVEKDTLGEVSISDEVYYGIHTVRALENFPITGRVVHSKMIQAMVLIKKCAALTNVEIGNLDPVVGESIVSACNRILTGEYQDQFVVDTLQGGAGTSTNMNVNEVIANVALEILGHDKGCYDIVHPLNHVNMEQSTNDVYPTALRIAAVQLILPLSEAFAELQEALQQKEHEFAAVIKMGRTQLQDAVPIMLGQEFGAYAQAVARDRWRLYKVEERLRQINIGGTAVGTGLNAERKYIFMMTEKLRQETGLGLARAEYAVDLTQNADVFVEVSGLLKTAAVNLSKIANDLRLLSSGPKTGFGEIKLPPVQTGSSIMPGKVNPVIPEVINQIAYQVMSYDLGITMAASSGQLELNAMLPLITNNLLESIDILKNGIQVFISKCIAGISANESRCRELLEQSYGLITSLTAHIGYEDAALIVKEAQETGKTVREVIYQKDLFTSEQLDVILNPIEMTKPGIPGKKFMKKGV